jgi:hypothetical protein
MHILALLPPHALAQLRQLAAEKTADTRIDPAPPDSDWRTALDDDRFQALALPLSALPFQMPGHLRKAALLPRMTPGYAALLTGPGDDSTPLARRLRDPLRAHCADAGILAQVRRLLPGWSEAGGEADVALIPTAELAGLPDDGRAFHFAPDEIVPPASQGITCLVAREGDALSVKKAQPLHDRSLTGASNLERELLRSYQSAGGDGQFFTYVEKVADAYRVHIALWRNGEVLTLSESVSTTVGAARRMLAQLVP